MRLALFALLLSACVDPKSPKTVSDFGKAQLELIAKRLSECNGSDHDKLIDLLDISSFQTRIAHSLQQKRVIYDRNLAQKCLDDLAKAPCNQLSGPLNGGSCAQAVAGQVKLGDDCFEFQSYEECAPKNYCNPTSECAGICTAPVRAGGNCGSGAFCELGTQCLGGICRTLADKGATCAGNTGVSCRDPYVCIYGDDTKTGTCSDGVGEGEKCRLSSSGGDIGDCAVGLNCQLSIDPANSQNILTTCGKSLVAGEGCVPGRYQCANYLACMKSQNGANSCEPPAQVGGTCGYFYDEEDARQLDLEIAGCVNSYCDADTTLLSPSNLTVTGTCRDLLNEGDNCSFPGAECAEGLSCDSTSETCVKGCPLQ